MDYEWGHCVVVDGGKLVCSVVLFYDVFGVTLCYIFVSSAQLSKKGCIVLAF